VNGPSSNEARSAEVDPEDSQERLRAVLSAARAGILLSDPQLAAWAKALGRSDWSPIRSGEALLRLFGPALEACCPVILSALPEPGLRRRSAWVFSRLFPERTTELVLPLIFAAGAEERRTGQTIAWRAPRQVLELAPLIARGGLQSPRSAPAMREALRPNGGLSESSEFVSPALSRMAGEVRRCAPSSWRSALEDPERRIAALRLLSQWRRGRRSLLSMLLALINQRLGEPYFEYQDWAIGALAELAEPSRLLSDFAEILKAGDENSKIEVLSLLSQSEFDISSLIPAMLSALRQGSESVRRLALEALTSGRLSPALASEALATTRDIGREEFSIRPRIEGFDGALEAVVVVGDHFAAGVDVGDDGAVEFFDIQKLFDSASGAFWRTLKRSPPPPRRYWRYSSPLT
jgi:hypothetical protein